MNHDVAKALVNEAFFALRKATRARSYAELVSDCQIAIKALHAYDDTLFTRLFALTRADVKEGITALENARDINDDVASLLSKSLATEQSLTSRLDLAQGMKAYAESSPISMILAKAAALDVALYERVKTLKDEAGDADATDGEGGSAEYNTYAAAMDDALDNVAPGAGTGRKLGEAAGTLAGIGVGHPKGGAAMGALIGIGAGAVAGAIWSAVKGLFGGKKKDDEKDGATESSGFWIPPDSEDYPAHPCHDIFSGALC